VLFWCLAVILLLASKTNSIRTGFVAVFFWQNPANEIKKNIRKYKKRILKS